MEFARQEPEVVVVSHTAFVKGLTAEEVNLCFQGCTVSAVRLPKRGRDGRAKPFLFVDFGDAASLDRALTRGGLWEGKQLRVERDHREPALRQEKQAKKKPKKPKQQPVVAQTLNTQAVVAQNVPAAVKEEARRPTKSDNATAVVKVADVCIGPVDLTVDDASKEEIVALPLFKLAPRTTVVVASTRRETSAAVAELRKRIKAGLCNLPLTSKKQVAAIGFDTETRPTFRRGEAQHKVALVQLATRDLVVLFRLYPPEDSEDEGGVPLDLLELLRDPTVLKLGVGSVRGDVSAMKTRLPAFDPRGSFFDIDGLVKLRFPGIQRAGLRGLAASLGGFRLSKAQQCSNWEVPRYTDPMIRYAACDAQVALAILDICLDPKPPKNAHYRQQQQSEQRTPGDDNDI